MKKIKKTPFFVVNLYAFCQWKTKERIKNTKNNSLWKRQKCVLFKKWCKYKTENFVLGRSCKELLTNSFMELLGWTVYVYSTNWERFYKKKVVLV